MLQCTTCERQTLLDDVCFGSEEGWLVCLRCFGRKTGTLLPMPESLRRQVEAVLASIPVEMFAQAVGVPVGKWPPLRGGE